MRFSTTLSCALILVASIQAGVIRRVFTPSPSPDGKSLLFAWQGDIWKSGIDGSNPLRLTVHPATESNPRWTPDGSHIVFNSNRAGSDDIYIMDASGHDLKRLTFDSAPERLYSVDNDYAYGYGSLWGRSNLFKVSLKGGEVLWQTKHSYETSYHAAPMGSKLIFVESGSSSQWTQGQYRGVGSGDIWVADNSVPAKNFKNLTNNDAVDMFPMPLGDKIYFTSNRSGVPNLWVMDSNGKGAKQLTHHTEGTVRWPSLGGGKIAYEQDSDIWVYDLASGKNTKLAINVPDDGPNADVKELSLTTGIQAYSFSPDAKRIAMILRGDVFVMTERGGLCRRVSPALARADGLQWLDSKTVIYTSRRNGKSELYKADLQGKETLLLSDALDIYAPNVSPDGKWVSFARGFNQICVMPAAGGEIKVVSPTPSQDAFGGSPIANFSPDSKWVVFNKEMTRSSDVIAYQIATGKSIQIGSIPRAASIPAFTPNGKSVYVMSSENEKENLYEIALSTPDVTFSEDDLDQDNPTGAGASPAGAPGGTGRRGGGGATPPTAASAPVAPTPAPEVPKGGEVKIEARGILDRMRLVASDVSGVTPAAGGYYANVNGQLSMVTAGSVNPVPGVKGPGLIVTAGGKPYLIQAGSINRLAETGPTPISFSATVTLDNRAEERALFDDVCWAISRAYYDPKLHGKDLAALRTRYQAILPFTQSRADFYALMGEFVEEFNSSHMGATAPADSERAAGEQTGWLSVDFDDAKLADRHYVVSKVTVDGAGARAGLAVGDEVLSVNDQKLGTVSWAQAMKNMVGRKTVLKVQRGGKEVTLNARPSSELSKTNEFYEEYVAWTRAQVEKLSGGKLTYMHVKGMDEPSYQRFLREIRTLTNDKKGVILDVRFNGGGSTSHKLLGILMKQPWLLRSTRATLGEPLSENIYRGDALELPTALMTNEYSFSNAEIMSEGFRRLKRGPIVGQRTAGGVIGTGSFSLFDGGAIRMPSIGCFDVDGKELERDGRMPDVVVTYDPNLWSLGRDAQLEAAVKELLKKVK